jgi:hypothetical protein
LQQVVTSVKGIGRCKRMEMNQTVTIELQLPLEKETFQRIDMTELWKAYWNAEIEEFLEKPKKPSK